MLELSAFGHVARDCPKKKQTISSIDRDLLTDTMMLDDSSQAVDLSGFYFNALPESGLGPLSDESLMHLDNWSRQWCSSIGHFVWSSAWVFSRVELEHIDRCLLDLGFFFRYVKKRVTNLRRRANCQSENLTRLWRPSNSMAILSSKTMKTECLGIPSSGPGIHSQDTAIALSSLLPWNNCHGPPMTWSNRSLFARSSTARPQRLRVFRTPRALPT